MNASHPQSAPANQNLPSFELQMARVVGAREFSEGNVNDTWEGELLLNDSSQTFAIIKDISPREIANEILGSAFASACGLPVPRVFLAVAEEKMVPAQFSYKISEGYHVMIASERQSTPPLGRRWRGKTMPQEVVDALASWRNCGATIAFDTWVANTDRHEYNLLFESADEIWLIDHGLCFNGPFWQPGELVHDHPYPNQMTEWLCPRFSNQQLQELRSSVLRLCEATRHLDIDGMVRNTYDPPLLTPEIGEAMLTFLKDRLPLTPRITGSLSGIDGLLT